MKEPANFYGKYYYGKYDKTAGGGYKSGKYISTKRRNRKLMSVAKRLGKLYARKNRIDKRRK